MFSRQLHQDSGQRTILSRVAYDADAGLAYLAEAVAADRPTLFADYLHQTKITLDHRGVHWTNLLVGLDRMARAIIDVLPVELGRQTIATVEHGRMRLKEFPSD